MAYHKLASCRTHSSIGIASVNILYYLRDTMRYKSAVTLLLIWIPVAAIAQHHCLRVGVGNNGVCFGNAERYNGIRFNYKDTNVTTINGVNCGGQTEAIRVNGISIGVLASLDSVVNGLQLGLATAGYQTNGLSVGALGCASTMNGVALSVFTVFEEANGVQMSLLGTTPFDFIGSRKLNGVGIGGLFFNCERINGLSVAAVVCYADTLTGVSVACFNATTELHGLQFGLLNHAANNKRPFRTVPLVNMHFRNRRS